MKKIIGASHDDCLIGTFFYTNEYRTHVIGHRLMTRVHNASIAVAVAADLAIRFLLANETRTISIKKVSLLQEKVFFYF